MPARRGPGSGREPPACSSRCRSPPRAAARSAATCPPMPAAPRCCATATRASSCSASRSVLADGRVWDGLRGLRKDNTGYDLKQLFIGAEGTLGVVTAAVLKLYPAPRARATAFVARRRRRGRRRACSARLRAGARRPADRLRADVARCAMALSRKHHPGLPDPCPATRGTRWSRPTTRAPTRRVAARVEAALARGARGGDRRSDATIAQSGEQAAALWALRENIAEAQRREGPNIKHDISLPVSAIPAFLDEARDRRSTPRFPGVRFVTFGHLGDGNLHYNLAGPERLAPSRSWRTTARANRIVHDLVDGARRQHQRRARHRPAEARRARSLQERASSST